MGVHYGKKLDVAHIEGGQRNICSLETCFGHLQALMGPQAPLRVLNGSQWTAYCAMRIWDKIFHYRKSGHCSQERWTKSDDLRHVLAVFRLKWPPKGHWGSLKVPKGQPNVPWEVEIKYSTMGWFHYGTTGRCLYESWTKKCMIIGMLLPFEVPPRPNKGPQWIPMDNLVCHEKLR